jgi:hypothetical protein
MDAIMSNYRRQSPARSRECRADQALGDLKAAIISGGPGMTGTSAEPPASAQNSLQ